MSSYDREMLLRAKQLVAAKNAVTDFMHGPGGLMLGPQAFSDIARALGHLSVRYNDAKKLLIEEAIDKAE